MRRRERGCEKERGVEARGGRGVERKRDSVPPFERYVNCATNMNEAIYYGNTTTR